MLAYRVKAIFPKYGPQIFSAIIFANSKQDAQRRLISDGWQIKKISDATAQDATELDRYEEVLRQLNSTIMERQDIEAEKLRRAKALEAQKADEDRRAKVARAKAGEEDHDLALFKAAGYLLSVNLEAELIGNTRLASICAKVVLFFDQANVNCKDLFTAISIDFAEFQSQTACRRANEVIGVMANELNECLKIDQCIDAMSFEVQADRISTENSLNAIGSRTHMFGGSGEWLFISMLSANSAVREDERTMESLRVRHLDVARRAKLTMGKAYLQRRLLEFRAKTIASMLLVACGRSDTIDANLPLDVEEYVLYGK